MALAMFLIFRQHEGLLAILHNLLLAFWGMRLGVFLFQRERQSSSQGTARTVEEQYGGVSLPRKFVIWLGVSVLYVLMFLPGLYQSAGFSIPTSAWAILTQAAGLLLMVAGAVIEGLADHQKSTFKQHAPQAFCNVCLYRWVRCPNYLGEILFWLGSLDHGHRILFHAGSLDRVSGWPDLPDPDHARLCPPAGALSRKALRRPACVSGIRANGAGAFPLCIGVHIAKYPGVFRISSKSIHFPCTLWKRTNSSGIAGGMP